MWSSKKLWSSSVTALLSSLRRKHANAYVFNSLKFYKCKFLKPTYCFYGRIMSEDHSSDDDTDFRLVNTANFERIQKKVEKVS